MKVRTELAPSAPQKKIRAWAIIFCLAYPSCNSAEQSDSDEESTTTEEAKDVAAPGSLALESLTPAESMEYSITSLESTGESEAFSIAKVGSLAIETGSSLALADEEGGDENSGDGDSGDNQSCSGGEEGWPDDWCRDRQHPDDAYCDQHGEPYDATLYNGNGGRIPPTRAAFSPQTFYCKINVDGGTETVLGGLKLYSGIICEVERQGVAYDGKLTSVEIQITEDCFSKNFVANNKEEGRTNFPVNITAKNLETGAWTSQITLQSQVINNGDDINFYFLASDKIVAFKMIQSREFTSVSIDRVDGILSYESIGTHWGNHMRIFAKGELDAETGKFSKIDQLEGIWQRFEHPDNAPGEQSQSDRNGISAPIATVKGSTETGFLYRTFQYQCQDESCNDDNLLTAGTFTEYGSVCTPTTTACGDNSGLSIDESAMDFLAIHINFARNQDKMKAWGADSLPICMTGVDTDLLVDDYCSLDEESD